MQSYSSPNPATSKPALSISILSPQNKTYTTSNVPLIFTVSGLVEGIAYSLDGQDNVTVTENTTLTELTSGTHTLTFHAKGTTDKSKVSETVYFSIAQPAEIQQEPKSQPGPSLLSPTFIVAFIASVGVACAGFLIYFKKRNR